ncbi:MAG: hypothetical protein RL748_4436 [Pseudomonadota bacterium]|jgi:hypothetical protein
MSETSANAITCTIHVADPARGGGSTASLLDQIWYELCDNSGGQQGIATSYGLVHDCERQGQPFGIGQNNFPDWQSMQKRIYQRSVEIDPLEYEVMKNFSLDPAASGFGLQYVGPKNRSVGFVWKAMELAGMNPAGYDE